MSRVFTYVFIYNPQEKTTHLGSTRGTASTKPVPNLETCQMHACAGISKVTDISRSIE